MDNIRRIVLATPRLKSAWIYPDGAVEVELFGLGSKRIEICEVLHDEDEDYVGKFRARKSGVATARLVELVYDEGKRRNRKIKVDAPVSMASWGRGTFSTAEECLKSVLDDMVEHAERLERGSGPPWPAPGVSPRPPT